MTIKYTDSRTYKHSLGDVILNELTNATNRSKAQTLFLYQLCGGCFETLFKLEEQIKNCFIGYCPGTIEEVTRILSLEPKSKYFSIKMTAKYN